eukprot:scaffold27355_cov135-Isochrysis_galbana.AAC.2
MNENRNTFHVLIRAYCGEVPPHPGRRPAAGHCDRHSHSDYSAGRAESLWNSHAGAESAHALGGAGWD